MKKVMQRAKKFPVTNLVNVQYNCKFRKKYLQNSDNILK